MPRRRKVLYKATVEAAGRGQSKVTSDLSLLVGDDITTEAPKHPHEAGKTANANSPRAVQGSPIVHVQYMQWIRSGTFGKVARFRSGNVNPSGRNW